MFSSCPLAEPLPDGGEGDNGNMTVEVPDDAFQIKLWNTSSCLSTRVTGAEDEGEESGSYGSLNKTILSECNSLDADQYWRWYRNDTNQLLHVGSLLCLSSMEDKPLVLRSCNDEDPRQQWLCAGSYLEQPYSGECVTAVKGDEETLEDELDRLADSKSEFQVQAFASLSGCVTGFARQRWGAVNMTSTNREPLSLCTGATSHVLPHCYIKDSATLPGSNGTWLACDSKGYYTKAFHRAVDQGEATGGTMECCATSDVFTGHPESPAVALEEECEDEGWHSYADALAFEGRFQCPEGMFLKGVNFTSEGVRAVRCCKPSTGHYGYDHCFVDVAVSKKQHDINACSLPGYRIMAVQKTECDSIECVEEITCCV